MYAYAANYLSENFSSSASDRCASGATPPQSSVSSEYQNPGMFSKEILINMQKMMEMIYKSLGQIYMLGHGLICFATDIAYTCVGTEGTWFGDLCALKIPNFGFMICGFIIYMVTFFLTMTIGMYFVDVSFKLGFAVLFLPICVILKYENELFLKVKFSGLRVYESEPQTDEEEKAEKARVMEIVLKDACSVFEKMWNAFVESALSDNKLDASEAKAFAYHYAYQIADGDVDLGVYGSSRAIVDFSKYK